MNGTTTTEEDESPPPGHTGLGGRRRLLLLVVVGMVGLTTAGATAAAFVRSPAQAAAETAPPAPGVLTAPVEKRVLNETLVTRGQVVPAQRVTVSPGGSADKDVNRAVVTKVKAKAQTSPAYGSVLLEVSGRPVFVLPGDIPAYRDLRSGLHGDDVRQLQRALAQLGHATAPDSPGVFGDGTDRALSALYDSAGYEALSVESRHTLPTSEVVYVAARPVRVDSVAVGIGDDATGELMTLTAGRLMVRGSLEAHQKNLVSTGDRVQILSDSTGEEATGIVTSVATEPTSAKDGEHGEAPQEAGGGYSVQIKPEKPLAARLTGMDVRLTVVAASTTEAVLAVPTSAISLGADGRTTVTLLQTGGHQRRVEVGVGMKADGYVQITPRSGELSAGAKVIVGVGAAGSPGGAAS
ncbi:hypothetical protein [Streptomyces sp. AK02-01A]|uniref:hypothetical protein n=1 Tax=Streptomyces sp. AK02-01A TaxID=3028648 RepID=UPI0029BA3784|nr:hypothetical protein [Streptomyces sp. AK02-01A]MDX3851711.1 hypothetical protein [Streptomyces sp. AK02-01A]